MSLHHLTIWVPDLERATASWGWLLERLGYEPIHRWESGRIWQQGGFRMVVEQSPDMVPGMLYSRLRPGLNHLAFAVPTRHEVEAVAAEAVGHGWSPMRTESKMHRLASGAYAAYLEDADGFEVELVTAPDA
jgi:catechol 2,3-dioxygenase-like lactoylglutathione lyase family enzyme